MEAFLDWALYFSLCLTLVESTGNYNLFAGPKIGETRRYQACSPPSQPCSHCFYCDPGVLSDSTYEFKQSILCNQYYKDIKNFAEALLPEEIANGKIPVCNVGQVPGCGPPPQDHIQPALFWYCDPGYSSQPHSVYFSCALICNYTNTVAYQYYCNESLRWELVEASNSSCRSNVTEGVVHASTTKTGTAWKVPVIIVCTVIGVVGLVVVTVIYRRRKLEGKHKKGEQVPNGDLAHNGFSKINNFEKSKSETNGIEMAVMNGNASIQSVPQDDQETDLKTIECSGPEACASTTPLTAKIDNRPAGAEISNQANGHCGKNKNGLKIRGECQVEETQFVKDSKTGDCSENNCCNYKHRPSQEEKD